MLAPVKCALSRKGKKMTEGDEKKKSRREFVEEHLNIPLNDFMAILLHWKSLEYEFRVFLFVFTVEWGVKKGQPKFYEEERLKTYL